MNFMVTDSSGSTGWVIGYTDDGTRSIDVPDRTGPTTYEFAGVTYGKNGANTMSSPVARRSRRQLGNTRARLMPGPSLFSSEL